jgi:hypothetical protein
MVVSVGRRTSSTFEDVHPVVDSRNLDKILALWAYAAAMQEGAGSSKIEEGDKLAAGFAIKAFISLSHATHIALLSAISLLPLLLFLSLS